MPSRSVAALFALLVLLSVTVTGAAQVPQATGLSGENAPASLGATPATQLEGDGPPKTKMVIHVQPNGDARWSVTTTFELETDSDVEAFERLATEFEDGETTQLGLAAFERASEQASTATGRPMEIANVHRDARRVNDTGRLVLAFTWTNFAKQRGERLIVRDAFETPNGTWLPSLAPGQTLVIRPPPGYGVDSSPPIGVENGTLRWSGETTFGSDGPWVIYRGSKQTTVTTTTPVPTGPFSNGLPVWGIVLVGGVGALAVAAYVLRDGAPDVPDPNGDGAVVSEEADGSGPASRDVVDTAPAETADEDGATGVEAAAADAEGDETESDDAVDEELLSDEERVERLLEQNGGRMKQANIVKETGWSNAKVSQLLSAMADDGRIEKLRLGRENLISFPDEDVADFES
ncbi:hypothetical protein QA599_14085 [Haloarculaceae archaeon H-GB1-1]|nr:hypothetical protein [Haloarculaceae archaeon H-GB1-1]